MTEPNRDNVVQLRQYGNAGWQETRGKIYKALMAGKIFRSGAMSSEKDRAPFRGELPLAWWDILKADQPDYIVYSYQTPIAWHVPDDNDDGGERWVVPDVKYKMTTTRHQNLVRTALIFNKTEPIEKLEEA